MNLRSSQTPAEVRTFLIADVRGYTRYTQEHGDEAAARLAAGFAEVVQATVESVGGKLVELRGDEALVVFSSPRQAIRTAVALQRAFVERMRSDDPLPLRVGIGLDAGEAVPVGDGFRGGALNIAARLCSLARPGEVLLTESLTNLARHVEDTTYVDRGRMTLKGLNRPVHVFKVVFPLDMPDEPSTKSGSRPGWIVVTAAACVCVVAIVLGLVLVLRDGKASDVQTIAPDAAGLIDPTTGQLLSESRVGDGASAIALGAGGAWVANSRDGTVAEIDSTGTRFYSIGGDPSGIAIGFGVVWVSDSGGRSVVRISPSTHGAVGNPIAVGNGPGAVVVGGGSVWVANTLDGTVSRIDPKLGRQTSVVEVAGRPDALAVGNGSVWVASGDTATLTQISATDAKVVRTSSVGNGASGIAVGAGGVWVANALDGTVSKIDPSLGSVVAVVRVAPGVSSVAIAGGNLWVASPSERRLYRLDPKTAQVVATKTFSAVPTALAGSSSGGLWLTAQPAQAAHRGGVLTVSSYMSACACLDPAFAWQADEWRLLITMYDGLVGYRKAGGAAGATLAPDLAETIPIPADGGRTYSFVLRPNIRFSDGTPLRASDVRATFERMLHFNRSNLPPFYAAIRGANACLGAAPCDLSTGIVSDNASRTVTFHLTSPDPDFLFKLALPFAFVLPGGAPHPTRPVQDLARVGADTIPGTGPYTAASFTPMSHLSLRRNPYFRVFSPQAQPAGFPDRIEARLLGDGNAPGLESALPHVLNGRSDWVTNLETAQVKQLLASDPAQLHSTAAGGVQYLMLSTHRAPFNDLRARQAVAFAIDRQHVASLVGGSLFARVACQILPPTFIGFRPYCPYTKKSGAGIWNGTDLPRARQLVAASHTGGAVVNIIQQAGDPTNAAISRYAAGVLRQLGYRPRVRIYQSSFGAMLDPNLHGNVLDLGWVQDYTAPSDFIDPMFSCASLTNGPNVSRFCVPAVDKLAAHASRQTEPAPAGEAWARVDHAIVDQVPAVPLYTLRHVDFVSPRVHNYTYNPEYGVLFDQLWVR